MILAPRYIPRLASTIGLFTNYGLRNFAKNQGLLSVQGAELATGGDESEDAGQDKAVAFRKRLVELGAAYVKLGTLLEGMQKDREPDLYRVGAGWAAGSERAADPELAKTGDSGVFDRRGVGSVYGRVHSCERPTTQRAWCAEINPSSKFARQTCVPCGNKSMP